VLGLDAVAIGRAFLIAPKTMGQRLVRAKRKIRRAGIAFEIPAADQIRERLDALLNAIYAAYGRSWEDATGVDPRGADLGEEAIWLARVLRMRSPDDPEVSGLLALMLHCEARHPARRSAEGRYVPPSEQDPRDWNVQMVEEAERELVNSAQQGRSGASSSRRPFSRCTQSELTRAARTGRPSRRSSTSRCDRRLRSVHGWPMRLPTRKSAAPRQDWLSWIGSISRR
jgi:RNA polymerase sigma-70 factor (ECF subfamily)